MSEIKIRKATDDDLERLGVSDWATWTCKPSTFDWEYRDKETCYVLEGEVRVKTGAGEVSFGAGDIVTFTKGLRCVWTVIKPVRKVYRFNVPGE
ncbi:cupin domain-containing protein [bacterium]|nr:cupin domain-containing protein [bacterium]